MTPQKSPVCLDCKNYDWGAESPKCNAFDVIPDSIWLEGDDHKKPLPGQKNDIVFEPAADPKSGKKS